MPTILTIVASCDIPKTGSTTTPPPRLQSLHNFCRPMRKPALLCDSKMASASKSPCTLLFILTLAVFTIYTALHRHRHHPSTASKNLNDPHALFYQNTFLSSASNYTVANYLRHLTLHPHLAGTPPAVQTALYVKKHFESLGFETHTSNYTALLSYHVESSLIAHFSNGSSLNLPLSEPRVPQNGVTTPYHAYSPSGSAYGMAVFLNYGSDQDYIALGAHGVDVEGCIGVVRRGGGLSRNAVVEKAAAHGVAAVLMYTEGDSDGDKYRTGVERGTVMNGLGDPLSPGWAGLEGGESLGLHDPQVTERFPTIPSMPVSAETAETILKPLEGARLPQEWRENLKMTKIGRVGPGPIMLNFTFQVRWYPRSSVPLLSLSVYLRVCLVRRGGGEGRESGTSTYARRINYICFYFIWYE